MRQPRGRVERRTSSRLYGLAVLDTAFMRYSAMGKRLESSSWTSSPRICCSVHDRILKIADFGLSAEVSENSCSLAGTFSSRHQRSWMWTVGVQEPHASRC